MLEKIILASPRGFCAGVEVAIDTVKRLAEAYPEETIYVKHAIVHNDHVIEEIKSEYKNVKFIEELSEIPNDGARVIFSAHGTPTKVYDEAKKRKLKVTDATCMLVEKVHEKARRYANRGYEIILIGHKGHQEVIGTMGQVEMHLLENVEGIKTLGINPLRKVAYITQTTLSTYDTKEIEESLIKEFPNLVSSNDDICYATTNRQEAVMALLGKSDLFFVVGGKERSNSKRLVETAEQGGIKAYLISNYTEINPFWLEGIKNVGVTSGASTPENLVRKVAAHLQENYGGIVEEYVHKIEHINFPEKELV